MTSSTDSYVFLREFLRKPTVTGAIAPSSRHLAAAITHGLNLREAGLIVEYGPGTGSFTRKLMEEKGESSRLLSLEVNPEFAERLRRSHPKLELHECSVERAPALLSELGLPQADVVVSGLPWAAFGSREQTRLLEATCSVLRPGGRFVTFAYAHGLCLPSAHRFRERLHRSFTRVRYSPVVWRNLPPAFVYRCVR
ncbi:MAG: methyltransferase domain-containing protein [Acidobacteria bacterium]|nr:methyltransferase domain-containing protein [Acidobacteriota bacterium]